MAIANIFEQYLRNTRVVSLLVPRLCIVLMSMVTADVLANEKRVTVPIALPFQQGASVQPVTSVAASSTPVTTYNIIPRIVEPGITAAAVVSAQASSSHAATPATSSSAPGSSSAASIAKAVSPIIEEAHEPSELEQHEPENESTIHARAQSTAPVSAQVYPAGHPQAFVAEFEDYIAKKVAPFVPGVAVVIVSQGQVKSLQAYGVKRAGTREKTTPDTVFRLASVSKTFAGTAGGLLVNEGKITWDTTVTSQLGDVAFKHPRYGKQITFRHLLSQSSGLPRHTYTHFIDQNMSYADIVHRLRYVNFACQPGKCFSYQNVAYSLAGDMIRKKAGMSYPNYVEQKILQPLGMRSASLGLDNYRASPNRASPHIPSGRRWIPTAVTANWYRVAPAAGVNASIADMSHFLLAQMGKRQDVLPLAVLNQIQGRVIKNNYYAGHKAASNAAYGVGWRVFDYGKNKNFVHHGGWVKGFRSEMVFNRELQIGMVFLTNSETRLARDVIFNFLDMHAGTYSEKPKATKKVRKKPAKKPAQKK